MIRTLVARTVAASAATAAALTFLATAAAATTDSEGPRSVPVSSANALPGDSDPWD